MRYKFILNLSLLIVFILNSFAAEAIPPKPVKKSFYEKESALVVDANNGRILFQQNANRQRYPASLTKLMTLYLTFEAIELGYLQTLQKIKISKHAASMEKSKLGLKAGQEITVHDAVLALIVKSANDAAVALAEAISGSEKKFAKEMTLKARELGMKQSVFKNASGLPDLQQRSTAHDLAKLAMALRRDFKDYYHLFSRTKFNFEGTIYETTNKVVNNYPYADGLKTGYINASGFNLITSATKGDKRLIGVVLGGETAEHRDQKMISLLDKYIHKNPKDLQKLGWIKVAKKKNQKTIKTAAIPFPVTKPL